MGRLRRRAALAALVAVSLALLCSCRSGRPYGYWDSKGFRELRPLDVEAGWGPR